MENKVVSIIIPVFNAGKCLQRCLDSLRNQSYKKLEIIFVNDASTDNSLDILTQFKNKYENLFTEVKILSQPKNKGVAEARNLALDNASGEYLYSLDADDYIDRDTILEMVKEAERVDADLVGIEWYLSFANNERHVKQPQISNGKELFIKFSNGVARWNLWLWMIRRELIERNNLRFMAGINMGEDIMLMLKISYHACKVSVINKPFYHYVQTNSNAITKEWSSCKWQIEKNVYEAERYITSLDNNPEIKESFMRMKLNIKLPLIISSRKKDYDDWRLWFPEANEFIMSNKELPFRTKFIQWAALKKLYFIPWLYYKFVIKFIYGVLYK